MKVFEVNPKEIIDLESGEPKPNPFKGSIKMEVPFYKERTSILKALNADKSEDVDSADKIYDLVVKHVKEMKVKLKDGTVITSIEDLGPYREGCELINALAKNIMGGFIANP